MSVFEHDQTVVTTPQPLDEAFLRVRDAETALRIHEEEMRLSFELSPVGQAHASLEGRWLRVNDKLCEITGYSRDQLLGMTFQDITLEEDLEKDLEHVDKLLAGEIETWSTEKRYLRPDHSTVWVAVTVSLLRGPEGAPKYFLGVIQDIAQRKENEAARATLAAIVENSSEAIISESLEGTITSWNAGAERVFGYTSKEAIGRHISMLGTPEQSSDIAHLLERVRSGEAVSRLEAERVRKDGRRLTVTLSLSPIRDSLGKIIGIAKIARDITEIRQAQKDLVDSEDRLRLIFNSVYDGLLLHAPEGHILDANETFVRMYGLTREEALELDVQAVSAPSMPQQRVAELWTKALAGEPQFFEWTARRPKDQSEFPIEVFIRKIRLAGSDAVLANIRDITERKRAEAEIRSAQEQLARTNEALEEVVQERTAKLRNAVVELEHMSYSIVHDLRAPLRAIQGFGAMLETDPQTQLSPEGRDHITRMKAAANRMDHLIRDVLSYSKIVREELPVRAIDLTALLRSIVSTYPEFRPPTRIDIAPNLPWVLGNEAALTQCFSNLFSNAVKFVRPRDAAQIAVRAEPGTHGSARIIVEDRGIGIAPEYQNKIFGMFQRLSNSYEGTGIGLAIVRKAVERMGGRVGVESELGKGSRFYLELPRA